MLDVSLEHIVVILSGYMIGSIPWAFIIGKMKGVDIRKHGSGNVGATNVRRVLGRKWGILCFALDFLKGFLPVVSLQFLHRCGIVQDIRLGVVLVSVAAVAGHMWPLFLSFKGGKGISTIAGIILALAPLSFLTAGGVWAAAFYSTRYVSLASILAALALPVTAFIFSVTGLHKLSSTILVMLAFLAVLAIFRHRANIKRLMAGTENRFEGKRSEQ